MANLSQQKRERMLAFLAALKAQHTDDDSLMALGEIENELKSKKYGLIWEEHEEAVDIMMRSHIPVFTSDNDMEINANPSNPQYNFLLEGDNLHSLKLLEKTHRGKIDVIYIDPPYNTGKTNDEESSGFIYDDKLVDENDTFIHSKWLSFMKARLEVAKCLLAPDGVIFISIGKEEIAPLRLLCDEIFDESNLLGQIVRRTKTTSFRGNYFALRLDYILCYSKGEKTPSRFMDVVEKDKYTKVETSGEFAGQLYKDDTAFYLSTLETRPNQRYFIKCPDGELVVPPGSTIPSILEDGAKCVPNNGDGVWRWECEQYKAKRYYLSFKKTKRSPLLNQDGKQASWNIYTKSYYCEKKDDGNIPTELLLDFINRNGTEDLKRLGIKFTFPKPVDLIRYLIQITNKRKDITVLDFFAGSGTTAQAVLELNRQDGGNRRFILCTNNENRICESITYPRIKTVITGKRPDGTNYSEGLPSNLLYYRTDFLDKTSEELSEELIDHIREMIQLEHGVKIDDEQYVIIMDDDELDDFERKTDSYTNLKAVFINQDVFLSASQEQMLDGINTYIIPDYYFESELREAGEIW